MKDKPRILSLPIRFIILAACCAVILSAIRYPLFAAFKDDGWGARPLGMGGAFTAVADDTNAQLYNPAGITQVMTPEASFMYAKLFHGLEKVDMGLNYFSYVHPFDEYELGILWANFVSAQQYRENTVAVTGAYLINDDISVGASLKYLEHAYVLDIRTVGDPVFASGSSKAALTIDAGILYKTMQTRYGHLALGLSLKNITQPDVGLKTADRVPMEIRAGVKGSIERDITIIPAFDVSYRLQEWGSETDKMNLHLGVETRLLKNALMVRAGGNMNEISLGVGFTPKFARIDPQLDYAFILPLTIKESQGTHRIALTMRFDLPEIPER